MMDIYESSNKHAADWTAATINDLKQSIAAITAERDEWKRRCDEISKAVDLSHDGILESITVAESLIVLATTLGNIIAIAEGRDND